MESWRSMDDIGTVTGIIAGICVETTGAVCSLPRLWGVVLDNRCDRLSGKFSLYMAYDGTNRFQLSIQARDYMFLKLANVMFGRRPHILRFVYCNNLLCAAES
jgi:hypothetical protein